VSQSQGADNIHRAPIRQSKALILGIQMTHFRSINCAFLVMALHGLVACGSFDRKSVDDEGSKLRRYSTMKSHLHDVELEMTYQPSYAMTRKFKASYALIGDDYAKPLVVLVHGGPGGKSVWTDVVFGADGLSGLSPDAQVVAVDLIGHGITEGEMRGFVGYSQHNLSCFLDTFIEAIQKDVIRGRKFMLVGHSYGGETTWRYAARRPDKLSQLVLINSAGFKRQENELSPGDKEIVSFKGQFATDATSYASTQGIAYAGLNKNAIERDLRYLYYNKYLLDDGELTDEYWLFMKFGENFHANLVLTQLEVERDDRKEVIGMLRQITCPVLLLWGREDPCYTLVTQGKAFKEYIPQSSMIVLKHCGHLPHQEYPGRVAQLLRQSLGLQNSLNPAWIDPDL
jgi:pimeloyl-ACP methyl ester carboxylesterase